MARPTRLVPPVLLCALLSTPAAGEAQRSGLIIDLGLGPGLVSANTTVVGVGTSDRESEAGLMLKFNIGGVVGESLELYLATQALIHSTERQGTDRAWTGIVGVGATYPVAERFSVRGAAGLGRQNLYKEGTLFDTSDGLGLLAGARYALTGPWVLDLDVIYAGWNDGEILGSEEVALWAVGFTVNWLGS